MIDLSLIWIVIIAIGVFIYVVLDGFDVAAGLKRAQRVVLQGSGDAI